MKEENQAEVLPHGGEIGHLNCPVCQSLEKIWREDVKKLKKLPRLPIDK